MWSSIEQILKPANLSEATELLQEPGSVVFAGGSYLVGNRAPETQTLVDINHLLNRSISSRDGLIHVDAGCTLQSIVEFNGNTLREVTRSACPSKNIRNQRTLGGEIAWARSDSDILVFLLTVGARIMFSGNPEPIDLVEWDGTGIILEVIIPDGKVKMERVAVLDSAPAYLIIGLHESAKRITICVGGKMAEPIPIKFAPEEWDSEIQKLSKAVEMGCEDDHLGSRTYKSNLVITLLMAMRGDQ